MKQERLSGIAVTVILTFFIHVTATKSKFGFEAKITGNWAATD